MVHDFSRRPIPRARRKQDFEDDVASYDGARPAELLAMSMATFSLKS
jgi:hypothetical protein